MTEMIRFYGKFLTGLILALTAFWICALIAAWRLIGSGPRVRKTNAELVSAGFAA